LSKFDFLTFNPTYHPGCDVGSDWEITGNICEWITQLTRLVNLKNVITLNTIRIYELTIDLYAGIYLYAVSHEYFALIINEVITN
jgi:hypothetical protein